MANRYVNSVGGSNTSPYDTWAKGATTLTTAITGSAAGDDFWVASDHAESTAGAVTLSFPGTSASPNRCMSVNRAGTAPPVAADILAGASVTTTGANGITINGTFYAYGLAFNCGTGATAASLTVANSNNNTQVFEACSFNLVTTATGSRINVGSQSTVHTFLNNCTVSFGNASQQFTVTSGRWTWINKPGSVAITGATIPTTLVGSTSVIVPVMFSGLDLSALGSGKTLFSAFAGPVSIVNCKLGASVTVATAPTQSSGQGVRVIGSSDTTNVERNEIYTYAGTLTTETTIKRTAGASDGTTAFTWKVVTTANAKRTFPFETFEGAVWNTSLVSKTLTVHVITDNVTLTDAEIWVEVEYLASGSTPVTTLITDANATVLTGAANQTSDSGEAWTTTGLGTPLKQALAVTFTPAMVGPIRWKVKVAKASATVYIDPNVDVT